MSAPAPSDPVPEPRSDELAKLPPAPRFEATPYRPDGGAPMSGVLLAVGVGILSAALLGFLASLIGQWFYFILIFPVCIGLGVGGAVAIALNLGKVRNPFIGALAGFAGGLTAMTMMHYCDYQRFLDKLEVVDRAEGDAELKLPGLRAAFEGNDGFLRYMNLQATIGITIGKPGRAGKNGLNIGYVGTIIYWLVEVAVVLGIVCAMGHAGARTPFCVACNVWKVDRPLATMTLPTGDSCSAISSGEAAGLVQNVSFTPQSTQAVDLADCVLQASVCPKCGTEGNVELALMKSTVNDKGEVKFEQLIQVTYPGIVVPVIEALLAARPAEENPPQLDSSPTPAE